MPIPVRVIHICYSGKFLNLLDSDDRTPLYRVKVRPHSPQMEMFRVTDDSPPQYSQKSGVVENSLSHAICTAAFRTLSLQVRLNTHGEEVLLKREGGFTTIYSFVSPVAKAPLFWETDGALTGDYKLLDAQGNVIARFRNKLFSSREVGSFELVGKLDELLEDEIIISGLAMLAMVQSLNLAAMVLAGGYSD